MKLKMFAVTDKPPKIVRAQRTRPWMDAFPGRHAYRCLPLAIANAYGWDILSPRAFTVSWNGEPAASDMTFRADDGAPYLDHFVNGAFSRGVVTFHTGYLFRTEPGWHLMATGPANTPKDGLAPLTGLIETDWLPYPFTMNWQFTRPGSVRFEAGEPFCRVFPIAANTLEAAEPEIHDLPQDPELFAQYRVWREQRDAFMARFRSGDAATIKQAWQKFYFEGKYPDGSEPAASHSSKLEIADPKDLRARATDKGRA